MDNIQESEIMYIVVKDKYGVKEINFLSKDFEQAKIFADALYADNIYFSFYVYKVYTNSIPEPSECQPEGIFRDENIKYKTNKTKKFIDK